MDLTSAAGAVFAAFGLAGAAGLNAWLPLLASALLARSGVVDLAQPFDDLSTNVGLVALAVAFALDFVGDKVPVVDHALHGLGVVIAPASGAALFSGQTGLETDLPQTIALVAGGGVAGAVHLVRAAVRPASTVATAGMGNPLLSLGEDVASAGLTLVAFALPVLAFVAVVVGLGAGVARVLRRVGRDPRAREDSP